MPGQDKEKQFPNQQQDQPGRQAQMVPKPKTDFEHYRASGKLEGKVAVITGGDSGIGRAVALLFAKEGADIAVIYLNEHEDAAQTRALVEKEDRRCLNISGDIGYDKFCRDSIDQVVKSFGHIDILVNNSAEQHEYEHLTDISAEQLERTFRTNIFSMFFMTQAVLPHLKAGGIVINSTSVTAYQGHPKLLDYASTKGAITSFTRSLAINLAQQEIRVNAVAPGPVWTPLIPASFGEEKVASFGSNTPMGRAGQPEEIAPCYLFLACSDSSYMTGQVMHPNGGRIVNG